jgi:heme exporter protein C
MIPDAARARVIARRGLLLTVLGLAGLAVVYVLVHAHTPTEVRQGLAQKIFTGGLYLGLRDPRLDLFAESSAEVGLVFSVIMLTTGPIWGKPVWGTWWTWDARLTLTLFLFFLFVGYMALRSAIGDPAERARFSAVVGILGLVLVPFVHLSVYLFRTLHPQPILMKPSAPSLPPEMLRTLLVSMGVFTLLYLGFVTARYGIGLVREARGAEHE